MKAITYAHWPQIRETFQRLGHKGAIGLCLLDMMTSFPELSNKLNFKVYCPDDDVSNGMIAIMELNNRQEIFIQPIGPLKKIKEFILSSRIINWQKGPAFDSIDSDVREMLTEIEETLRLEILYDGGSTKHFRSCNSVPYDCLDYPHNTYVGPLTMNHLNLVDTTWTYHNEHSRQYFQTIIQHCLTYALYSLEDEPLAWVTVNPCGHLTHLYCLEAHRRRGYAEYIIKIAVNDLIGRGRNILAYTVNDNIKARILFTKLGFNDIGNAAWVGYKCKDL